jgi:hypothetical protein
MFPELGRGPMRQSGVAADAIDEAVAELGKCRERGRDVGDEAGGILERAGDAINLAGLSFGEREGHGRRPSFERRLRRPSWVEESTAPGTRPGAFFSTEAL